MVVRLRAALPRPQVLLAKCVAAWHAACSQVEGASTEAEAGAQAATVTAWKSSDQLSRRRLPPARRLQRIRSKTKAGLPATISGPPSSPTTQRIVSFDCVGPLRLKEKEIFQRSAGGTAE